LAEATAGITVVLATPGHAAHYKGNWTVGTPGTSSRAPVVIAPVPGVGSPTLDGNGGNRPGCQTKACDGPVLTIATEVHIELRDLSINNADNTANGYGGALQNDDGGAVLTSDVNFSNDQATYGGAIDNGDHHGYGTLSVDGGNFDNDVGSDTAQTAGDGGAIDNGDNGGHGTASVVNATFSNDQAGVNGGAIDNGDTSGKGTLMVSGSRFTSNTSDSDNAKGYGDGGAIDNVDGSLKILGSSFSSNIGGGVNGTGNGGAVNNYGTLYMWGSDLAENISDSGGGISNGGTASVVASNVSGNEAFGSGGGIENAGGLTVSGSSLANNESGSNGGAIDSEADGPECACLTISDSTLTGNLDGYYQDGPFQPAGPRQGFGYALTPSAGAAIYSTGGTLLVWSSTFAGDSPYGGADVQNGSGPVFLAADIFDDSCQRGSGRWHDLGYNIGDDGTCLRGTRGDVPHGAGKLRALANNGGPTWTMLPLKGNPALGAVPVGTAFQLGGGRITLCPTTDARGVASTVGRSCDAGAVQLPAGR
jgi:hypothetical protein